MNRCHPIIYRLAAVSTKRSATNRGSSSRSCLGLINNGDFLATARGGQAFSSSSNDGHHHAMKLAKLDLLHVPVMRDEVLKFWLPEQQQHDDAGDSDDKFKSIHLIDGTVGLGGHALAAIESNTSVQVLGIDRDESVLARAKKRTKAVLAEDTDESRIVFHHGSFSEISPNLLSQYSFPTNVNGILIDLGMNSAQVDNPERGFTFRKHGPLDMRFDTSGNKQKPGKTIKARDIINNWPASDMALVFQNFADEPYAVEIATGIIQWRKSLPRGGEIKSTLELRYIIEEVMEKVIAKQNKLKKEKYKPKKKVGKKNTFEQFREIWHSPPRNKPPLAKKKKEKLQSQYEERKIRHANHVMRCFQALRIEVNNELDHIQSFFELGIASKCLEVGGRLVVIAFHPGEDKLVKKAMNDMVISGDFKLLTPDEEGLRPTAEEVKINGRSRTARLRAVQRIR